MTNSLQSRRSGLIPFKNILFPTDFSNNSKSARDYACEFADQFGAKLHVLNVVEDVALMLPESGMFLTLPVPQVQEIVQAAEAELQTTLDPVWATAHDCSLQVAVGTPFQEIVRYVERHGIDLIVMGTHGRTGLRHLLLGSVAERVLRQAACPVLTIRSLSQEET